MKSQTRELLVTTKVAQHWQDDFEQRVDELIAIINRIDTEQKVQRTTEILDVYHHTKQLPQKSLRAKKIIQNDRPFEFLLFRN